MFHMWALTQDMAALVCNSVSSTSFEHTVRMQILV